MAPKTRGIHEEEEDSLSASGVGSSGASRSGQNHPPGSSGQGTSSQHGSLAKTGVTSTSVKVPVTLDKKGVNFPFWDLAFPAACELKGCQEAIANPMPNTVENSAALLLLISSVPSVWGHQLSTFSTAFQAYQWVKNKFTGGMNPEMNVMWLELMNACMTDNETIEEYFYRMLALKSALEKN